MAIKKYRQIVYFPDGLTIDQEKAALDLINSGETFEEFLNAVNIKASALEDALLLEVIIDPAELDRQYTAFLQWLMEPKDEEE